jgi:beta-lactamase regulating signal transducer with metallopeptidase domain
MNLAILGDASNSQAVLLVDAAARGMALLIFAAAVTLFLKRDSAATRHGVWLLAIVAVLTLPAISAILPTWRVLPAWANLGTAPVIVPANVVAGDAAVVRAGEAAQHGGHSDGEVASAVENLDSASPPVSPTPQPAPASLSSIPQSAIVNWNWLSALPLAWFAGVCLLMFRLILARWVLWNTERQAIAVAWSDRFESAAEYPIGKAFHAAYAQLRIRRRVTLLIHPDKTIPIVWGIHRHWLLLPAAAEHWSDEQLRSILLHELAHIQRRDTLTQLVTQVTGALHWFNPLVWFAAWRLSVERERACDNLVLANGVRPSAYAAHLLDVVTGLISIRWTKACGLAMARASSLEGRLVAVLSENINRRCTSATFTGIALAIAVGIAAPIAMLHAADQNPPAEPKSEQISKPEAAPEEQLQWGEPVNGLRAALVIRPIPRDPKIKDAPEFYLAVQNVSDGPIRLKDTVEAADLRHLWLRIDGELVAGFGSKDPSGTDLTLKPHEIVYLRMFAPDPNRDGKHSTGAVLAEGLLKDTHQSMVGELRIKQAVAGAWTGKLKSGEVTGVVAAGQPQPKDKHARALLSVWQHHARGNGNFPGGLVGRLGDKVQYFIRINTGDTAGGPYAKAMSLLVRRFDAMRDWTPAEIADLLDDVAAVTPVPLETTLEEITQRTFRTGEPLPNELANAPWGEAQPSGLRLAWLLEPRAAEHRLGTPLKTRILVHNAGKSTVVFRTRTWHQVGHAAHDAKGAKVDLDSTFWTTIGRLMAFRLNPGEFIEINGPGIGVGKLGDPEDWQQTRVGTWVHAQAGDEVTLTTDPVPMSDWNEKPPAAGEPGWWLDFINAHLAQDLPLPADAEERRRLVYRAGMELFGTPLSANEIDFFVSNRDPNVLEQLAKRLAAKPGFVSFMGDLTSGETKFRVLAADPDAAKKPRTATNPGRYTLREGVVLAVSRRGDGDRIVNEAKIQFSPASAAAPVPSEEYELKLPDGYNTWAAAWVRGETTLWLQGPSGLHRYDFSDAGNVKETTYQKTANLESVPKNILEALRAALEPPPAPKSTRRRGPPAATAPDSKAPGSQ